MKCYSLPTHLASLPGDFNFDGTVDAADYFVWRNTDGGPEGYSTWRIQFGQTAGSGTSVGTNAAIPEPETWALLMFAEVGFRRRRLLSASRVLRTRLR